MNTICPSSFLVSYELYIYVSFFRLVLFGYLRRTNDGSGTAQGTFWCRK